MTMARSTVVDREVSGIYHCVSRCVRRAFLCGMDSYTGKDYEHRREWVAVRLETLAGLFGIEVFTYAVMSNHLHVVVRTRPDLVCEWTDLEVVRRWCALFRPLKSSSEEEAALRESMIATLAADGEKVKLYRERLGSLSWFMRCLNEPIARRANREDECTGRFWEGRFKCQRLMDEGSVLVCMAYVDLNPVRAELACGLEDSRFTGVYDRLTARKAEKRLAAYGHDEGANEIQRKFLNEERRISHRADWLVALDGQGRPFLEMDLEKYLALVEWTGQSIRSDKPGYLPVELVPVLDRYDLDVKEWVRNVESYGGLFYRIAGKLEAILTRARQKGQRWLWGKKGSCQLYRDKASTA